MKRLIAISVLVVLVFLTACSGAQIPITTFEVVGKQVSVDLGSYTDISVAELQTMLADKNFTLINVHIPFEGDLATTDLSIPYDQIAQNLDKLPDKSDKIVLYCRSGRMSAIAAEKLVSLGYTNVWNLSGGMVAWEKAGLTIEH